MEEFKKELQSLRARGDEEKFKKYKDLAEILEEINFKFETIDSENAASPRRRKISRAGSESNDGQIFENHENALEETSRQIETIKRALSVIYDMENTNFRKFISRSGKKRRNGVSRVYFLKRIMENGRAIPLWIGKDNEKAPPLCGAIEARENYITEVGDMVAAYIKQDKGSSWILAEVIAYDPRKKEYIVDDIYEEQKMEQVLSWNKIIPLPRMRADPEINPEALFTINSLVLALYPGTTCFYPAFVNKLPAKPEDPYALLFEDDTYETGYSTPINVHQRYVIHFKKVDEMKTEKF